MPCGFCRSKDAVSRSQTIVLPSKLTHPSPSPTQVKAPDSVKALHALATEKIQETGSTPPSSPTVQLVSERQNPQSEIPNAQPETPNTAPNAKIETTNTASNAQSEAPISTQTIQAETPIQTETPNTTQEQAIQKTLEEEVQEKLITANTSSVIYNAIVDKTQRAVTYVKEHPKQAAIAGLGIVASIAAIYAANVPKVVPITPLSPLEIWGGRVLVAALCVVFCFGPKP